MKTPVQSAYRPDIDGLRAIAILSVIVFHINKNLIPGGFVGVDIFFVISGFLISLHILKDIERGRFSLVEFYRRRIKRLALPLLLVVFVTVLAALLLMIPEDFGRAIDSAIYALLSLANVYFWLYQDTSYFAADSNTLPLLHLWSLGVEEQFYIFWPLLLMFAYRTTRAKAFFMLATVVALASFVFGELWFQRDASFVYYMLPARAGELLVGALVAMAVLRRIEDKIPEKISAPMAAIGLSLILASLFLLNENQVFPGVNAIMPTLGTALLILAGHCVKSRITSLLELKLVVWIGLVSYSAYLWHWPLLAFLRYEHIDINLFSGVLVLGITFWLAFLSYMLVELPAREWDAPAMRVFLIQYVIPGCLIALIALAGKHYLADDSLDTSSDDNLAFATSQNMPKQGTQSGIELIAQPKDDLTQDIAEVITPAVSDPTSLEQSSPENKQASAAHANPIQPMFELDTGLHDKPRPAYEFNYVCQPEYVSTADMKAERCIVGADSLQPPRVILWGDSNAAHYVGVIGTIARKAGFKFRNISAYSCPPLITDPAAYVAAKRLEGCHRSLEPILTAIKTADVVIIAAAWSDYIAHSGRFTDDFLSTVQSLTAAGKFVVIMGKVPVISSFDINCKAKAERSALSMECAIKEPLSSNVKSANSALKAFADKTKNVAYFDVTPYLCNNELCSAYDVAGNALYFDTGHLSMPASWKIGESIVRQQGIPEPFTQIRDWLNKNPAH